MLLIIILYYSHAHNIYLLTLFYNMSLYFTFTRYLFDLLSAEIL